MKSDKEHIDAAGSGKLDVQSFNMGELSGKAKERELCKRNVCMYCGGRALGYKRIPDGPNDAGNWTHQYTATLRTEDSVLCQASAIFARENFERGTEVEFISTRHGPEVA